MRVFLIQLIAVVVGQFLACGDIPVGHNPNGAGRDLYRAIRVARMVDVPGFIGLNIAKMSPGASCMDFAVKAHFRRS
jgi:hypothetical protein